MRNILPIKDKISQHVLTLANRRIRIGIGGAWVGRDDEASVIRGGELMLKCYQQGFRYFDTSRAYGESERALGWMIQQIPRNTIFLATKARYNKYEGGFESFKRSYFESFERLNTEHIDLFQIHDTDNFNVCIDEVLPFLEAERELGHIDYIGMGTRSINAHCHALLSGRVNSALTYLEYNLAKNSYGLLPEISRTHKAALINSAVLLYGLIKSDAPLQMPHGNSVSAFAQAKFVSELQKLCRELNIDIVHAAIQFSLLNPDIDMTLNGIKSISNLESTIRALNEPLYPEQWSAIFSMQRDFEYFKLQDEGIV